MKKNHKKLQKNHFLVKKSIFLKFNISKKINIIKYNFLLKNCEKNVKMIKKRIKNGFLWQFMA